MSPLIDETLEEIFGLYLKHGAENYIGENVSQIEHMCQAAQLAEAGGFDEEVILAAFFHDIGHLAEELHGDNNMGGYGVKDHEQIGGNYLRSKGFPEKVARLVESHVQAKRYLTFADKTYYESLSEASKKTLEFQGGRMSETEAHDFESDPLFELMIQMRRWDEQAKMEHVPLPDLNRYKAMARNILERKQAPITQ